MEADSRSKVEVDIREKAEKTRNRAEAKARVWEKSNAVQRSAADASANIIVKLEAERAKR